MVGFKLLLTAQLLSSLQLCQAQNSTQHEELPLATYVPSDNSWFITAPSSWNFTTILSATNQSSIVNNTNQDQVDSAKLPSNPPLVYVNGTYSVYATNAYNYALLQDINVLDDRVLISYSDETWALPVVCEWPISGIYSRLNRILYYALLTFALVWRHHEWLIAGALASATTYSGAASIQAWVQFGVVNKYRDSAGDNDNEAIMGILAAALLMAVPLINWSRTLRRLHVRPILIYWAIIVFVGYLLVIIGQKMTEVSSWSRHAGGIMFCDTDLPIPNFQDLGFIDHDFITKYSCNDPCYDPPRTHPFHSISSITSRIICGAWNWTPASGINQNSCFAQCPRHLADTCYLGHSGWTDKDFRLNNVGYYGILPVAVFELFFVLCFGRMSPEDIRDLMFKAFVGRKLMSKYRALPSSKQKGVKITWRIGLAQTGGMIFYIFALLTYLVCTPFFIFNIIYQERLLRFFPDAEDMWEQGQWLPWVVVVLTIGAAIVGKYHHYWKVYLRHYLLGHKKPKGDPKQKAHDKSIDAASWVQRMTWRTRKRIQLEWNALKDFCTDPFALVLDDKREKTFDHPTAKYSFVGSLPYPESSDRHSKQHYRGPWIKAPSWKSFDVEFAVQADDRTLRSWERYQRRYSSGNADEERIVYDVELPPVPSYPDGRTVTAKMGAVAIGESMKAVEQVDSQDSSPARKGSTLSYTLQAIDTASTGGKKQGTQVSTTAASASTVSSVSCASTSSDDGASGRVARVPPVPSSPPPAAPVTGKETGAEEPSVQQPLLSRQDTEGFTGGG